MGGGGAGDQPSVRSSLKSDSSKRMLIIQSIRSIEKTKLIKGVNSVGWVALLVLIVTSTIVYI